MRLETGSDRLPPQNLEAEQAVLGAILIENGSLYKCADLITSSDFYRESHRKIYDAMIILYEQNEAIDLVTVGEVLGKNNALDSVGGTSYLATLANQAPTAANIKYHSRIVREKALMRSLISSTTEIATRVYEETESADDLLDFAEQSIFHISDKRKNITHSPGVSFNGKPALQTEFNIAQLNIRRNKIIQLSQNINGNTAVF